MDTRAWHPHADAPWLELLAANPSRDRYIEHLIAVYGFECAIEAAVALTPSDPNGVGAESLLRERGRSGLIVQDLLALGLTPSRIARLPHCSSIVPFRDVPEAFGWMYVVERATLLHDAIVNHLVTRFEALPCEYLSAFAGSVGARWQEFGRALDRVATTSAVTSRIITAAREAFDCQRDWHSLEAERVAT